MNQTQQTQTHTPTPWAVGEENFDGKARIMNAGVNYFDVLALVTQDHRKNANAAFIVEACNQHEALQSEVKALREALEATTERLGYIRRMTGWASISDLAAQECNDTIDAARRALSLSQVKP